MHDTLFIIRNHSGHYWGRGKRWVDGRDTARVLALAHRDEAVNTWVELSARDTDLRCEVLTIALVEGKMPKLDISTIPLPDDENIPSLPLENTESATIISDEDSSANPAQTAYSASIED